MSLPLNNTPIATARDCIWAVIVTFKPDKVLLNALIESLFPQVEGVIIVNNGNSLPELNINPSDDSLLIRHLGHNTGIAAGLNRGIEEAALRGASHVIFCDQDSDPAVDMVQRLRDGLNSLRRRSSVSAVGPRYVDRRTGKAAPVLAADTHKCRKMMPAPTSGSLEVDMLITSGSLVPMEVLDAVGMMREDLFIDHVDMEWCFRARAKGFRSYVIGDAVLMHSIGDMIMPFLGRRVIVHSPVRHYYMIRNGIALQSEVHMSSKWCRNMRLTMCKQFAFYSLFLPRRRERFPLMLKGIFDGLRGRLGPLAERGLSRKSDEQG